MELKGKMLSMTVAIRKLIGIVLCAMLLLGTALITSAQAESAGGEGGGFQHETSAQAAMEVVACAIFLRVLSSFGLP